MQAAVEGREMEVDGVRVFYRRVPGEGTPTVYCHGNPTHSEEWLPFLRRGGPAIAIDMPGWGRSGRPDPGRFDHSMHGLSAFLGRCLEELGVAERRLVVHDWGALALIGAQRRPELVERLVVVNGVPLLPGYRWHWVARIWRRRPLGELANATATRASLSLGLRQARADRGPMPAQFVDMIWNHWDRGTGRAVLSLYRDAEPDRLAAAGRDLGRLACPALVLWGARDPYIPSRFALAYARALPNAEADVVAGAGHWPWIDDPSAIDRILDFLE
ncbi:MAG TPA: alpha/beta hydrolase [Solirubrobacterales bacterium]